MEYCGNIISNVVRRRGEQVIGVLVLMILMVSVVVSTPNIHIKDMDVVYKDVFYKPMGEEINPFATGIQVPHDILGEILAETNMDIESITFALDKGDAAIETPIIFETPMVPEIPTVPEVGIAFPAPTVPEVPVVPEVPPIVPEAPIVPETPVIPESPVIPEGPTHEVPPITAAPPETVVPPDIVLPPETVVPPDTVAPPNTAVPPETVEPPVISPTEGFLVNEEGMIYGIEEEIHNIISDRILTIPAEGCTGIAQNAFYGMTGVVYEFVISSNIVNIEAGVFQNMPDLAWIDVANDNPVYQSMDGMLSDKSMTTLLAVPSCRSGTLGIPRTVTRLEAYSLANIQATAVDLRGCGLVDISDMVFGNADVNGLIIYVPEQYLDQYEQIFGKAGAIVKIGEKYGV